MSDGAELTMAQKLLIDHITLYLRDRHPDRWEEIIADLKGPERREYLSHIGLEVMRLAESLFLK